MTVDNAANVIKRKNKVPQIRPPAISLNTFGSVINTSPGPSPGLIPNAKHAGKIISPAIIATDVSKSVTLIASPVSALSFPIQLPNIANAPIPILNVKNDCPIAANTVVPIPASLILDKSGFRQNSNPSIAFGNVNALTTSTSIMKNKLTIIAFVIFSTPFSKPREQTASPSNEIMIIQKIISFRFDVSVPKILVIFSESAPTNSPFNIWKKYASIHPPTVVQNIMRRKFPAIAKYL